MPCPFYGKSANELLRILVPLPDDVSGGRQCALVTSRQAPCTLEMAGDPNPELANCEWSNSNRAIDFATFKVDGPAAPTRTRYPD